MIVALIADTFGSTAARLSSANMSSCFSNEALRPYGRMDGYLDALRVETSVAMAISSVKAVRLPPFSP